MMSIYDIGSPSGYVGISVVDRLIILEIILLITYFNNPKHSFHNKKSNIGKKLKKKSPILKT